MGSVGTALGRAGEPSPETQTVPQTPCHVPKCPFEGCSLLCLWWIFHTDAHVHRFFFASMHFPTHLHTKLRLFLAGAEGQSSAPSSAARPGSCERASRSDSEAQKDPTEITLSSSGKTDSTASNAHPCPHPHPYLCPHPCPHPQGRGWWRAGWGGGWDPRRGWLHLCRFLFLFRKRNEAFHKHRGNENGISSWFKAR